MNRTNLKLYHDKLLRQIATIAWLFLALLSWSCRPVQDEAELRREEATDTLTQQLEAVYENNQLMGMSVLVMTDGEVVYQNGFGWAQKENEVPATANTPYRLASISKSATATALMMLYDEGKVDLDADVSRYLGFELRNPKHPGIAITLRQLLSHQSSIVDGEGYYRFSRAMFEEPLYIKELFLPGGAYYTEDLFLGHEPGAYFTYANCPWGIIAGVVERISGQRFDRFCREKIFEPLGMDASFNVRDLEDFDSLGILYRYEEDQWAPQAGYYPEGKPAPRVGADYVPGSNGLLFGPQGSLRSSVADLVHFMKMHIEEGRFEEKQLLQAETARMMHEAQWTNNGSNGNTYHDFFFSWGLGFHRIIRRDSMDIIFPDRDMVGHPGEAYGLISDMYFHKESGTGVIFATNGSKKDFAYGKRTTFYLPEEQVFEAVYPFVQALE